MFTVHVEFVPCTGNTPVAELNEVESRALYVDALDFILVNMYKKLDFLIPY